MQGLGFLWSSESPEQKCLIPSLQMVLRRPYGVPGIEPESIACKRQMAYPLSYLSSSILFTFRFIFQALESHKSSKQKEQVIVKIA